jgi:outer membrane murein-binding lipoprotein Lpp
MKIKFLLLPVFAAALLVAGCVSTADGHKKAAIPFLKDSAAGQYQRSMDQVYDAAKTVIAKNGQIVAETALHNTTNRVQAIEARVNQRNVWVRVEAVDPKLTAVTVQARTRAGGRDIELAHELEKEIALELSAR